MGSTLLYSVARGYFLCYLPVCRCIGVGSHDCMSLLWLWVSSRCFFFVVSFLFFFYCVSILYLVVECFFFDLIRCLMAGPFLLQYNAYLQLPLRIPYFPPPPASQLSSVLPHPFRKMFGSQIRGS